MGRDQLGGNTALMAHKLKQPQLKHQAPPPTHPGSISDLVETSVWLGTYRERMRIANVENQPELATDVRRWTEPVQQRRAEPA